ncbi:hypothetical protein M431DRAFT_343161 [Trichoderma harzianum CBS 226.95]|uniref:Uncharacterized protein n=1 Tax=Trichoderma harzianum CBS 226.95 TaxID=983964 RepID=A0A2T4AKC1_TRIHA|nr:hypothetical protein M431DRAFT_343161 [Trichoderma harzianum CBS 226.95]PTB57521.1 hypothetical protein M431DRAFT_343161 [Trichoderma harzianum CBS 226.95]
MPHLPFPLVSTSTNTWMLHGCLKMGLQARLSAAFSAGLYVYMPVGLLSGASAVASAGQGHERAAFVCISSRGLDSTTSVRIERLGKGINAISHSNTIQIHTYYRRRFAPQLNPSFIAFLPQASPQQQEK